MEFITKNIKTNSRAEDWLDFEHYGIESGLYVKQIPVEFFHYLKIPNFGNEIKRINVSLRNEFKNENNFKNYKLIENYENFLNQFLGKSDFRKNEHIQLFNTNLMVLICQSKKDPISKSDIYELYSSIKIKSTLIIKNDVASLNINFNKNTNSFEFNDDQHATETIHLNSFEKHFIFPCLKVSLENSLDCKDIYNHFTSFQSNWIYLES